jgi:hypothetical protein
MKKRKKTINLNYNEALDNLIVGIGKDYDNWNGLSRDWFASDESMKQIKEESSVKFKKTLYVKPGRKFDKVIHGTSVWGFVAKKNGEHKGIPYFTGDVFKAATWRAPAKHVRGSIFYDGSGWYSWTGPNYL